MEIKDSAGTGDKRVSGVSSAPLYQRVDGGKGECIVTISRYDSARQAAFALKAMTIVDAAIFCLTPMSS